VQTHAAQECIGLSVEYRLHYHRQKELAHSSLVWPSVPLAGL